MSPTPRRRKKAPGTTGPEVSAGAEDSAPLASDAESSEETAVTANAVETEAAAEAGKDEAPAAEVEEAPVSEEAAEADETGEATEEKPRARRRRAPAKVAAEEEPAPKPAPKPAPTRPSGRRPVVRAHAKYVRTSARKARLVCDHIRGKSVSEARAILEFAPRAAARDWKKLLDSAVANAENNHELLADDLRIFEVYADEGPTIKRFRPRALGRATQIRKRTSHLSISLTPKE
jgi:ribosomal protein L22